MGTAISPDGAASQLQAQALLELLDAAAHTEFEPLARIAARLCGTAIARVVVLPDPPGDALRAALGVPGVIVETTPASAVPVGYCAAVPLYLADGALAGTLVGALVIADPAPRQLAAAQRETLLDLAVGASRGMAAQRDAAEREKLTQALGGSEQRLRALYESTPAMLHSIDLDGRLLTVSDLWVQTLGYTREEVIGRRTNEFMTERSRRYAEAVTFPLLLEEGANHDVEFQMVAKSGAILDVRLSSLLERDAAGRPLRCISVVKNYTEQLRAERALLQERQRLASLIDAIDAGTWELQLQTGEARFNDRWATMLGYASTELLTDSSFKTWSGQLHPDDLVRANDALAAHLRGASPHYECEVRLRHRDGHWVWMLTRGRVITHSADNQPEWMFGIHIDLSARKQQDEALRKSESFLHRTGEIAGVGGWELDIPSRRLYWSPQVCRMHGVETGHQPDLEEAFNFFASEGRPALLKATRRAIAHGEPFDMQLPLVRADGQRIWVRLACTTEFDTGRPARLLGAFQDITLQVEQRHALERANERIAMAADSGSIGIWEFDLRAQTITMDSWGRRAYGLPPATESISVKQWLTQVHPDDRAHTIREAECTFREGRDMDTEFRVVWPDGSVRHLRATARKTVGSQRLVGANWDVTPLRQLGAQLAEQHEMMRVTLQSIGDAVVTTNAAGCVTWLNPVAERLTGWPVDDARGQPLVHVFCTIDEQSREPMENPVAACVTPGRLAAVARGSVLVSRGGQEFGIEESAAPIRDAAGAVLGVVLVFRDVTEQRRLSEEMVYRAKHDALTGLVNRAEFETRLSRTLEKAHEDGSGHAMLYIDLDQFKLVNDACGHSVGDQLLQQVAQLLQESVRSRDTLGRLGGDEFAVILEHCSTEQAQRVAQKICDRMDDFRFVNDNRRFRIGASIGLVPLDARWATPVSALQAADTSCFAAKEEGRNRVHTWFDTDLAMRARDGQTKWATRLEQALDDGRFALFAQRIEPVVSDPAAALRGRHAEVLLRLIESDGSLVAPGAFLPAAERFHLASRIDRWVLSHATDWLISLPDLSSIGTLCINLSGQSIGDRAFHRHALAILHEAGAAVCQRVCLEITETAAVTNLTDAAAFIDQVRGLGVRIALDDFGAGASSFGYLKTLKVDVLKIDGQFISGLLDDPLDHAAVRCFVDVARVLGLRTVAEFVDRPELLVRLREIGVDYAQGYLLHRPEPLHRLLDPAAAEVAVLASAS